MSNQWLSSVPDIALKSYPARPSPRFESLRHTLTSLNTRTGGRAKDVDELPETSGWAVQASVDPAYRFLVESVCSHAKLAQLHAAAELWEAALRDGETLARATEDEAMAA